MLASIIYNYTDILIQIWIIYGAKRRYILIAALYESKV